MLECQLQTEKPKLKVRCISKSLLLYFMPFVINGANTVVMDWLLDKVSTGIV